MKKRRRKGAAATTARTKTGNRSGGFRSKFKSDADIEEYVKRRTAQEVAKLRRESRQSSISAKRSTAHPLRMKSERSASVGDDICPQWKRRTVKYLTAQALKQLGEHDQAAAVMRDVRKMGHEMTEARKKAEHKEAVQILKDAGMKPQAVERTMSTLSDGAGGVLLAKPFLAEVFVIIEEYGVGRKLVRVVPMPSKDLDLKSIATKPSFGWVDELGLIPETGFTFDTDQKLTTKKAGGILPWSTELDEDEAIALLPQAQMLIGESGAQFEDQLIFLADGTATYKSMTGILHGAANVYTLPATKTSFVDLTADDLSKMRYSVSTSSRRGAVWGMHPSILGVIERLKDSQGQYIYQGPSGDKPGRIWGNPVVEVDVMPTTGDTAVSKKFLWYGNPIHTLFGQRRGMTIDISREAILSDVSGLVTLNSYQQDAALMRVTERIGVKIPTPSTQRFASMRTAAA